jgi:type II secretory pathway pseudopilin PulG
LGLHIVQREANEVQRKGRQMQRAPRSGLTLIDILILVTLIVLLAALIGPRIVGRVSGANRSAAQTR